jgi:uncharacterized membrane protein YjjP (DUF1212 family)
VAICSDEAATDVLLAMGRAYHQAGVPADTLEDIMHDVAISLGVELQVNALPTSLTVAVGPGTAQRLVILRLEPGRLHLRKLALLNSVYRRLVERTIDVDLTLAEIASIDANVGPRPTLVTIVAYALLSLGASVLLGGGPREIELSTLIGFAIGGIGAAADRYVEVSRLFEVLAAFVATLVVAGYERFAGPIALYIVIIAGVVQLLPGFTLTTALHELASRHLVAGTARLGSVLVTLLSLGCGFALALALVGPGMLPTPAFAPVHSPGLLIIPAAIAMAGAIAIILRARARDFGWICASCVVAIATSRVFGALPGHEVAAFGSAFIVGVITNLAARYLRIPQAVMLIPGILVLVPGSLSYESILAVFQTDVTNAVGLAVDAVLASILIVAGTLLSQLLIRPLPRMRAPLPTTSLP